MRLDPDSDRAAQKYEKLRRSLIKYFDRHAPTEAEVLTDKTIDRVGTKIAQGVNIRVGLTTYVGGIAHKILLEYFRSLKRPYDPPPIDDVEKLEVETDCMRKCLRLYPKNFELLLSYLTVGEDGKLHLAEQMNLSIAGLRARIYRTREKLRHCLRKCLERSQESKIV